MTPNASSLRITMAQINPIVGDGAGNADKILAVYNEHQNQSDLIIFPELVLSGYQPEDLVLHNYFIEMCQGAARDIATKTKNGPALIIGTPWMNDAGERQNCALFISNGEIKHIIAKQELPNYGVFDEKRVFTAGAPCPVIDYMGHKLGIGICEDFWFPTVAKYLKDNGADILISINGSPFEIGKGQKRIRVIRKRIAETALPFIYVNQIGGQDEIVYDGGSFAMNADGALVHHSMFFYDDVETITFPFENTIEYDAPDDNRLVYEALKLGLKDYVTKNDFKGVLLGLSGGIDSALSAVIAVDALGADMVHCVMMPSPYTSQISLDDAKQLAGNLGCTYDIRNIQPAMDAYELMIPDMSSLALENIQSRARGMMLMAVSNTHGHMVLSTGNKSEMAVGYATLYGDMCGGFNALKDVYKTQVYTLSQWRNDQEFVIPKRIITRPPSAELKPNQTDQDSLPDYDILDAILHGLIEDRKSIAQLAADGFDSATTQKIKTLLNRAEYKRRQSAPGVKITSCSFGAERRMPITNKSSSHFGAA
jgi:NAD+ synthase